MEEAALHAHRRRRHACNYYDYAKDLCKHYRLDLRIHNLCMEEKRYIGVDGKDDFKNLKEDLLFLKSCRKTVLAGFGDYFKERFFEGKSIRQYTAEHEINRASVDYIQKEFFTTLAEALAERDKADGVSRLYTPDPDDEEDDPFYEDE